MSLLEVAGLTHLLRDLAYRRVLVNELDQQLVGGC